jgi:hypothetical protein
VRRRTVEIASLPPSPPPSLKLRSDRMLAMTDVSGNEWRMWPSALRRVADAVNPKWRARPALRRGSAWAKDNQLTVISGQ